MVIRLICNRKEGERGREGIVILCAGWPSQREEKSRRSGREGEKRGGREREDIDVSRIVGGIRRGREGKKKGRSVATERSVNQNSLGGGVKKPYQKGGRGVKIPLYVL